MSKWEAVLSTAPDFPILLNRVTVCPMCTSSPISFNLHWGTQKKFIFFLFCFFSFSLSFLSFLWTIVLDSFSELSPFGTISSSSSLSVSTLYSFFFCYFFSFNIFFYFSIPSILSFSILISSNSFWYSGLVNFKSFTSLVLFVFFLNR